MSTIGARIKQRREELKMSRNDLGIESGVTQQAVHGWEEKGAIPAYHRLKKIAEALETTVEWLSAGISVNVPTGANYTLIPLLGTEPEGGGDVQYHDEVGELKDDRNSFAYRRDFLEQLGVKPEWCRVVRGDTSMTLGDQLLVDLQQKEVQNGRVYVLKSPSGPIVRRLFVQLDQKVRVLADRPDIPEQIVPPEAVHVLGRVVAFQGTL
jgi:transcriptional regulator with XRE-family HTH domain